jgi:hypothetical protein
MKGKESRARGNVARNIRYSDRGTGGNDDDVIFEQFWIIGISGALSKVTSPHSRRATRMGKVIHVIGFFLCCYG